MDPGNLWSSALQLNITAPPGVRPLDQYTDKYLHKPAAQQDSIILVVHMEWQIKHL